ncbi:hypothetical protein MKJ04_06495 [Pontibacter sp. E15-1]|uniref:hypothetical protein n=1 Tax=Pontibacter sp. E15-1 TaxID=2919918 RepID=UPI001F4F4442|nr:hypothetical protein [Pontibacter sp. E15-1]MCJ8164489.1 hypothetical protein [Pontibacter sp. E15-1]
MKGSIGIVSTAMLLLSFISKQIAYSQTVPNEPKVYEVVKAALVLDSVPVLDNEKRSYLVIDKFTKTRYSDFFVDKKAKNKNRLTQADKLYLDGQNEEQNSIRRELLEGVALITQDSINQITTRIDKDNQNKEYKSRSGFVYYSIGKPVFTADGKKAFITINHICHYILCGESWTLLLVKEKRDWKVLDKKSLVKI